MYQFAVPLKFEYFVNKNFLWKIELFVNNEHYKFCHTINKIIKNVFIPCRFYQQMECKYDGFK